MVKRIMVAVVFIPPLLVMVLFCPRICVAIMLSVLCGLATHELITATGFVPQKRIRVYSVILSMMIPFWFYWGGRAKAAIAALLAYMLLLFAEALASDFKMRFEHMAGAFFAAVLIPFMLSTLIAISWNVHWRIHVLLPFVAAFTSDAFALFGGMLFGKHKLSPRLSPKKTVEGAVSGLVGAVVCCCVYGLVVCLAWDITPNYPVLALYGVLGSVASQLGDLAFSYLKRQSGIKDYGRIFPGHGGVLDRFDSMVFCAPTVAVLLMYVDCFAI